MLASWRQVAGYLIVTQIVVGGILESVGGSNGIRVAAVIKDFNEFVSERISYQFTSTIFTNYTQISTLSRHVMELTFILA